MALIRFVRAGATGGLAPRHCGDDPIKFGVITSVCAGCNTRFETAEIVMLGQIAVGKQPDPENAVLAAVAMGLRYDYPLHAAETAPKAEKAADPAAALAAEKMAREALQKAMAK